MVRRRGFYFPLETCRCLLAGSWDTTETRWLNLLTEQRLTAAEFVKREATSSSLFELVNVEREFERRAELQAHVPHHGVAAQQQQGSAVDLLQQSRGTGQGLISKGMEHMAQLRLLYKRTCFLKRSAWGASKGSLSLMKPMTSSTVQRLGSLPPGGSWTRPMKTHHKVMVFTALNRLKLKT